MFERYLTDVLLQNFGHLIENLDADQIRISAYAGRVSLSSLRVRVDALQHYLPNCPVAIVSSHIGNLELTIPWKLIRAQLFSKETSEQQQQAAVVLTDVTLVIAPYSGEHKTQNRGTEHNDETAVEKEQHVQAKLDALLLSRVAKSSTASRWQWIQTKLKSLLANLTVTIRNIQIQYRDSGANMGFVPTSQRHRPPLCIGTTLGEFTVTTAQSSSVKVAAAQQLAIYWDTEGYHHTIEPFETRHFYLLHPFSPSITLDLENGSLHIQCPPCRWALSRSVLEDVVYLRKSISVWRHQVEWQHLATLRPKTHVADDPRAWWIYAATAVGAVRPQRYGWYHFARAIVRRKQYKDLYETFVVDNTVHEQVLSLEKELTIEEIVAFRLAACRMLWNGKSPSSQTLRDAVSHRANDTDEKINVNQTLTKEHRYQMLVEMAAVLEREHANEITREVDETVTAATIRKRIWSTKLSCTELALQINDRQVRHGRRDRQEPVVRISSAFLIEHEVFGNGAWDLQASVGSFVVKDLTALDRQVQRKIFPYLVGPKRSNIEISLFQVDGQSHNLNIRVEVRRDPVWHGSTLQKSTTLTKIRVVPMEIVYITEPVEALSRILNTANMELADDYHHVGDRLSKWRESQKQRLLAALSHKNKTILVDVDVGAPTVLLPESNTPFSPMLIVDFGRLLFKNGDFLSVLPRYDNHWLLELSSIQVQTSTTTHFRDSNGNCHHQHVVEPFALSFAIHSRIENHAQVIGESETSVFVEATLPRLAFDLRASAVRLLRRLGRQWDERKTQLAAFKRGKAIATSSFNLDTTEPKTGRRRFEFTFDAPLLVFQFSNDVDPRKLGYNDQDNCPIINMNLNGIQVCLLNERSPDFGLRTTCTAKLGSVVAVDLYQTAGEDFMFLLSSVAPMYSVENDIDRAITRDLVSIDYISITKFGSETVKQSDDLYPTKLQIKFFELYIEWNPETLAALSNVFSLETLTEQTSVVRNVSYFNVDSFFDAEEEDFFDASSFGSEKDSEHISEIVSSRCSSVSDFGDLHARFNLPVLEEAQIPTSLYPVHLGAAPHTATEPLTDIETPKSFEISFELAKLKINFNKEVRHRRLLAAEMDETRVRYRSLPSGGSQTKASIGNLTFSDGAASRAATLYKEIIGLKSGLADSENVSQFSLEIVRNPRRRRIVRGMHDNEDALDEDSVIVDLVGNHVRGCDSSLTVRFSPMRFVYLQQLWFEIIDYFFEGIVGYEVWGNNRPLDPDLSELESLSVDFQRCSFTKFHVVLDSPVILFPVSYCSTDFLRLEAGEVIISNWYDRKPMRTSEAVGTDGLYQLFNNCSIKFHNIKLANWSGVGLSNSSEDLNADIQIDWPTGPTAPMNKPKWGVIVYVDQLDVALLENDFSLLQNIISHNIGEDSRNLDEWKALRRLPPASLENFQKSIFVHFGYDKKDVTPSTFDVMVKVPAIAFSFRGAGDIAIANANAEDIQWTYRKGSDRVSKQNIVCGINIAENVAGEKRIMLGSNLELESRNRGGNSAILEYSSTTLRTGENEKVLTITNGCVFVSYPVWYRFSSYFQSLPTPNFLNPKDVIQVGDRWYKIGTSSVNPGNDYKGLKSFPWIIAVDDSVNFDLDSSQTRQTLSPTYRFAMNLIDPCLVIGSSDLCVLATLRAINYVHDGKMGHVQRSIDFRKVEVKTLSEQQISSVLKPWSLKGLVRKCDGRAVCTCKSHSYEMSAEALEGAISFSDMNKTIEIYLRFVREMKAFKASQKKMPKRDNKGDIYRNDKSTSTASQPEETIYVARCENVAITIIDDSGRHFAGSQEILSLLISMLLIEQRRSPATSDNVIEIVDGQPGINTMLSIESLRVVDCLQEEGSPFRCVLSIDSLVNADISPLGNSYAVRIASEVSARREYSVAIGHLNVQYNPSMVIAMQRFIGRLAKQIRQMSSSNTIEGTYSGQNMKSGDEIRHEIVDEYNRTGIFSFVSLRLVLNKEHQGRSLIQVDLSSSSVEAEETKSGLAISATVGATYITDIDGRKAVHEKNKPYLTMSSSMENFVSLKYLRFSGRKVGYEHALHEIPAWIRSYLNTHGGEIDDFLEISISKVEVIYLSERTKELADYLSNGLPGKGMGATSRAAKGFVTRRIQKRSFLHLRVDSPILVLPQLETATDRLVFGGGEVDFRSWVIAPESLRKMLVSIKGVSIGTCLFTGESACSDSILSCVDLCAEVDSSSSGISISVDPSDIQMRIAYSQYHFVLQVLKRNIGKKIDRMGWDNLEVAWEKEASEQGYYHPEPGYSREVSYSVNARHVRYGFSKAPSRSVRKKIDVNATLKRFSMRLHRDDDVDAVGYDFILIQADGVELSFTRHADGDRSMASIQKILVEDMGNKDRVIRGFGKQKSPFSSIITGYSQNGTDSHLVITLDRSNGEKPETNASFVVNNLSITALVAPIQEAYSFVRCEWDLSNDCLANENASLDGNVGEFIADVSRPSATLADTSIISARFVFHYPRLIFLADEFDPQSRGLVLRGLSIINLEKKIVDGDDGAYSLTSIKADLQNISSFVYVDISDGLFTPQQIDSYIPNGYNKPTIQGSDAIVLTKDDLAIPLLLPVTAGLDIEVRVNHLLESRSLGVTMDPLSIMISSEDFDFLKIILGRWSRKESQGERNKTVSSYYDVFFDTDRLGLGLKKEAAEVIVDSTENPLVGIGDVLCSINDVVIPSDILLSEVVAKLKNGSRPLKVGFVRSEPFSQENESSAPVVNEPVQRKVDTVDISLSEAAVTLIDKEIPLFRGKLSNCTSHLGRKSDESLALDISASLTVSVDYFNLRIWAWEPFVEPGFLSVSAQYSAPYSGATEIAIEITDRLAGPILLNATDAFSAALGKLHNWGSKPVADNGFPGAGFSVAELALQDPEETAMYLSQRDTRVAADVALRFARRQRSEGGKPFVFRNETGISCAFAVQKDREQLGNDNFSFLAVGEYDGLQGYNPWEITIVAPGELSKFRIDKKNYRSSKIGVADAALPCLVVAFQSIAGFNMEALDGLQLVRPGEYTIPLRYTAIPIAEESYISVSWRVEHSEEETTLTLGSAFRIVSFVTSPIEIGVQHDSRNDLFQMLGVLNKGQQFHVPLWISMKPNCRMCARPIGGYSYADLDELMDDAASDPISASKTRFLECKAIESDRSNVWLATAKSNDNCFSVVSIDCCITLRNALPRSIQFEISNGESSNAPRLQFHGSDLGYGECAEVFSDGFRDILIRFKVLDWSKWISLSKDSDADESGFYYKYARVRDCFGVPLDFGLRIAPKALGVEVVVFAEIWILNTTDLQLAFGVSHEELSATEPRNVPTSSELSAAEAALKEISSLFETGDAGTGLRTKGNLQGNELRDILLLPDQRNTLIYEECFEYIEVCESKVLRQWWATEDPQLIRENLTAINSVMAGWDWIDSEWRVDKTGQTFDGWETSSNLDEFPSQRLFDQNHRYRRRRWVRKRECNRGIVNAFYQRRKATTSRRKYPQDDRHVIQIGVQANGGAWALTSKIPSHGTLFGAIRLPSSRWPRVLTSSKDPLRRNANVFEVCYSVFPLGGEWGTLSRLMTVSSRFLLRNDSGHLSFDVKQTGTRDETGIRLTPGCTHNFHWSDSQLPELISVRPVLKEEGQNVYKWSGGFDPLTIGVIPLRIRRLLPVGKGSSIEQKFNTNASICTIKMEVEIRPRTGGTGINICFQEEDENGDGSLFRIDNFSPFPIWVSQDGILANPSVNSDEVEMSDMVLPLQRIPFGLDVPFRQGKYPNRKAATLTELLRLRTGLAPLSSRAGIETTKVISLTTVGDRVRLSPSKLTVLDDSIRNALQRVRVIGVVANDGPTRVLMFRLMKKDEKLFSYPFSDELSVGNSVSPSKTNEVTKNILKSAQEAVTMKDESRLPSEGEVVTEALLEISPASFNRTQADPKLRNPTLSNNDHARDLIVSFRLAFSGFVVSLVDSAPSEIALVTLRNINALATWDYRRTTDSTIYITISDLQVDNFVPNAPYTVAVSPDEKTRKAMLENKEDERDTMPPLLVVGLSFAPKHKSGIMCLKSVTIAPRNLAIRVDLAFLIRLQKYALDITAHLKHENVRDIWQVPDLEQKVRELEEAARSGVGSQKYYFGGLTILPCNIKLSVAPARALTQVQASLEGEETAAMHQAVRKGDVRLGGDTNAIFGVKIGHRNATPLAVVRGVFKSIVVDALLRLDGASLSFAGVSLRNHIATFSQLSTYLGAHYMSSLRQNLPALLGSLAALGNPLGLARGLGDGVSDFVLEPVRGFQKSVQEMDASYLVDGVARGTVSLARHTVGGFADSAAALAETFSKNMAVLTLDRRYAQKRDRGEDLRTHAGDVNVALGLGSGVQKLALGFIEGVTGVVKAPIRGAEKRGFEGFAKGIGKGLLGLLVKPIIGISDGFTDVMIGVKGSLDGAASLNEPLLPVRPRRPVYGRDRAIRPYSLADAAAAALLQRTRLAGEHYLGHVDMGDRVALLSVKKLLILGASGEELLVLKFKHIDRVEVRSVEQADGTAGWSLIVFLNTPRRNGSEIEVITCKEKSQAEELRTELERGVRSVSIE